MNIIKQEKFRSMGKSVNEEYDMYRVTMLVSIREWNSFLKMWNEELDIWNGEYDMNRIKFKEENIKEYLDRRIIFWEETLKDLKENMNDGFWALDKNKLMVTSYIETYKNVKKRLFG
jgi:hypothetical protein